MPVSRSNNSNPSAADIYTITRLNREVRSVLEEVFPTIWVQGEISNLAKPASGHFYFTLKDTAAQVRCAMFKNRQSGLRFDPENGMQVLARANIGLYEGRGEYQLIIESLEPAGAGALQLAFEALKQKLSSEGLFDEKNKKPLPVFPEKIGIITSATGAAVRDILSILKRRYPFGNLIIYPVPVQGEGAAKKIANMISFADQRQECDVLILTRGGGSLEDLWAFNEEIVARAVFDCVTPLVCGVGHEIDFSIADFIADQRAPTPSAAAELVSPDSNKVLSQLQRYSEQLIRCQQQRIIQHQRHVELLSKQLAHPKQRLQQLAQRTDEYSLRLTHQIEKQLTQNMIVLSELTGKVNKQNPVHKINQHKQLLSNLQSQFKKTIKIIIDKSQQQVSTLNQMLETVSPVATLERGYAIVTDHKSGNIVRNTNHLKTGGQLRIRLAKAEIDSTIDKIHEK
jgi:exodeoxyribonuclease VII large subunit